MSSATQARRPGPCPPSSTRSSPTAFRRGPGRPWNPASRLSDIYGGTLRGVIDHLDYIAGLGFTTIWLNPFFPDDTHHGYHATDYFAVNPRLGTMDDMRELVDKAHERGIRLLLDFVGNHWGSKHASFQEARANRNSPYYNWYYWKSWPEEYVAYFDVPDLPKFNVDHPAVRDHLLRSVGYWMGDVRLRRAAPRPRRWTVVDFWTDVRAVARSIRPDAWMFGELVRPPDQQLSYAGLFDGALDFLLCQAMRDTFATGEMSLAAFDAFLNRHEAYFPAAVRVQSPQLSGQPRHGSLSAAGRQATRRKLKLAALVQFTLGGAPIVYNGTEVGVTQERGIHDRVAREWKSVASLWCGARIRITICRLFLVSRATCGAIIRPVAREAARRSTSIRPRAPMPMSGRRPPRRSSSAST